MNTATITLHESFLSRRNALDWIFAALVVAGGLSGVVFGLIATSADAPAPRSLAACFAEIRQILPQIGGPRGRAADSAGGDPREGFHRLGGVGGDHRPELLRRFKAYLDANPNGAMAPDARGAVAADAGGAGRARGGAVAAVLGVVGQVDAGVAALRRPARAVEAAGALRAHLAGGAAHPGAGIHAAVGAAGLAARADHALAGAAAHAAAAGLAGQAGLVHAAPLQAHPLAAHQAAGAAELGEAGVIGVVAVAQGRQLARHRDVGLKAGGYGDLYAFVPTPTSIQTIFIGLFDLTKPNYVLAVLAGLVQFFQTKHILKPPAATITQPPADVSNASGAKDESMAAMMNKQMMYVMPLMTVFIGISLPGGLTLYWLVMSALTLAQQVYVVRRMPPKIEPQLK